MRIKSELDEVIHDQEMPKEVFSKEAKYDLIESGDGSSIAHGCMLYLGGTRMVKGK